MDIRFDIYVINGQNMVNLLNQALFSKNCWKKNVEYESILYNYTELSVGRTFSRKIKSLYKLILKFVSPLHFIYVPSEITNFQKELFFKGHSVVEDSLFYFLYYGS